MNIKRLGANLQIEASAAKIVVCLDPTKLKADGANIILTKETLTEEANGAYVISQPGEYEVHDVFIYGIDTDGTGKVSIFSINADDITLVIVEDKVGKLSKKIVEQIGVDDILVVPFDAATLDTQIDLVSEFDPSMLIPLKNDPELVKKIAQELGVAIPEAQTKLKVAATDFSDEESSVVLALLA